MLPVPVFVAGGFPRHTHTHACRWTWGCGTQGWTTHTHTHACRWTWGCGAQGWNPKSYVTYKTTLPIRLLHVFRIIVECCKTSVWDGGHQSYPNTWLYEIVVCWDALTLLPFIQSHVHPGTIIHSDEWAVYNQTTDEMEVSLQCSFCCWFFGLFYIAVMAICSVTFTILVGNICRCIEVHFTTLYWHM